MHLPIIGTAALVGAAATPVSAADTEFFFVGNSYTNGMLSCISDITEMFEDLVPSWEQVTKKKQTPGAATFEDQVAFLDNSKWSANSSYHTVLLQDQSQVPGLGYNSYNFQSSLLALSVMYDTILAMEAKTIPMLFQTWGRLYGDSWLPSYYPDFVTMHNKLKQGYNTYASETSTAQQQVFIAPVGDVFKRIWDDIADNSTAFGEPWNWDPTAEDSPLHKLYKDDGSHPSNPYGCFVIQSTVVTAITGRNPLSYSYGESNDWNSDDEDLFLYYSNVIHDVVYANCWWLWSNPWGMTPAYPWVHFWSQVAQTPDVYIGSTSEAPAVLLSSGETESHEVVSIGSGGDGTAARVRIQGEGTRLEANILNIGLQGGYGVVEQLGGDVSVGFLFLGAGSECSATYILNGGTLSIGQNFLGNSESVLKLVGGRLELGIDLNANVEFLSGDVVVRHPNIITQDVVMSQAVHLIISLSKANTTEGYISGALHTLYGASVTIEGSISCQFEPGVVLPPGEPVVMLSGNFLAPSGAFADDIAALSPVAAFDITPDSVAISCLCMYGCLAVNGNELMCLPFLPSPPVLVPTTVWFDLGIILVSDQILVPLMITSVAPVAAVQLCVSGTSAAQPYLASGGLAQNMTSLIQSNSIVMFLNPSVYLPIQPEAGGIFTFLLFDLDDAGSEFCLDEEESVVTGPGDQALTFKLKETCIVLDIICPGKGTGDINKDAMVNVLDIVAAVDITLALGTPWEPELTECEFGTLDLTNDASINLFDLLSLVDQVVDS